MSSHAPVLNAPSFVIQRRLAHPLREVQAGLADRAPLGPTRQVELEALGFVRVEEPFRPVTAFNSRQPTPTWRATARLLTARGHLVAVVSLEVSMWSRDSTELQLRPDARHPERWSSRRLRRYFALAHRAADETARLLSRRADAARASRDRDLTRAANALVDRVGSRR